MSVYESIKDRLNEALDIVTGNVECRIHKVAIDKDGNGVIEPVENVDDAHLFDNKDNDN